MAGFGRGAALASVFAIAACGSSRAVPKAFEVSAAAVEGVALDHGADVVVVAPEVLDGWQFLYRFITETEFVLCLEGTQQDGRVVIDGFRLARMESTNVNSVRYQPCASARYVGTAHNHPPVSEQNSSLCYQSEPDRRSFGLDQRAVVDIVLCGDDTFFWVMKDGTNVARLSGTKAREYQPMLRSSASAR